MILIKLCKLILLKENNALGYYRLLYISTWIEISKEDEWTPLEKKVYI